MSDSWKWFADNQHSLSTHSNLYSVNLPFITELKWTDVTPYNFMLQNNHLHNWKKKNLIDTKSMIRLLVNTNMKK